MIVMQITYSYKIVYIFKQIFKSYINILWDIINLINIFYSFINTYFNNIHLIILILGLIGQFV